MCCGDGISRSSILGGNGCRVIQRMVFDVAVDLRSGSKIYGQWFGVELREENNKQF